MKMYASADSHNTLIAQVATAIENLYPVGLKTDTRECDEHPKTIKIKDAIAAHMNDDVAYIKPWALFLKSLPKAFKRKVRNVGFVHDFAYSGRLILERFEDESMLREKAIIFNVSWLADYFTVYGVDETFIKEKDEPLSAGYCAINVITTSPHKEFEAAFNILMDAIANEFPNHQFIPFRICQFLVKDIQTIYHFDEESTVYNALFNSSLDLTPTGFLRGDQFYGFPPSSVSITLRPPPLL